MIMPQSSGNYFDYRRFVADFGGTATEYTKGYTICRQGDPADALFYIISGGVKLVFTSELGKEAVVAILGAGDFFGEGCLKADSLHSATITTTTLSEIARFERAQVIRACSDDPTFSNLLFNVLLDRNERLKEDLTDQLFNSNEKRLARILLTLANSEHVEESNVITVPIDQEMLANMVGTTRSRINQFMNKFQDLGYVDYSSNGRIKVSNSLLNLILRPHGIDEH